ncbi:MAG: LacI family DNA-binding transcriptional regulator [Lachnospiraceae bacterium]|nr:LacI family DNA-binding transcriptional regulator [Lachnospiraceae bacterium]
MVTIKDISRRCGVSPATVSKALNGYGDISSETAELIRRTAEEMHYMPNAAARQLKTNSSHNIGVLFVDDTMSGLTHEYFSAILNSAKEEAELRGYDITFISSRIGGSHSSFVEHCRYRKCDGVLIASVDFTSEAVRELVESEFPTVTIDFSFNNRSCVMSDNVKGAYALTQYVIGKGHRRIAFIHGEKTSVTQKRLVGFFRACEDSGITIPDEYVLEGRYHDPKSSERLTEQLMKLNEPPTVIIYPDDYSYLGGLRQLEKMQLSVPEDVSAAGYDGINLSQVLRPRLTTYYQDAATIGKQSMKKLVESIENRKTCIVEQIMVSGKLLEGHSVKQL